jgi:hypothetical protein
MSDFLVSGARWVVRIEAHRLATMESGGAICFSVRGPVPSGLVWF